MFNMRCRDGRPLDLPLSADYQDTVPPVWSMAQVIHGIIDIIPSSPITNNTSSSCCILPTIHTLWPHITLHPKPHPMIIVHWNQCTLNMNRCIPHNLPMLQTQDTCQYHHPHHRHHPTCNRLKTCSKCPSPQYIPPHLTCMVLLPAMQLRYPHQARYYLCQLHFYVFRLFDILWLNYCIVLWSCI